MSIQNYGDFDHLDAESKTANQQMDTFSDTEFSDDWVSHIDDFNDEFLNYNGED